MGIIRIATNIFDFYYDGFRQMKLGKKLWLLIGIKLVVLLGIMKMCFFPNYLQEQFDTDEARSAYLLQHLTKESESWISRNDH